MVTKEVKTFYKFPVCEECGQKLVQSGGIFILTSCPPQKNFKCKKCGIEERLYEKDWPQTIYEWE